VVFPIKGHKLERVNDQMRDALSELLRTVKDPRVGGLVSVVRVEVSGDLSYAKVYVSALEDVVGAVKGLQSAAGYLRRELAARVQLRLSPQLKFIPDTSIAYGAHIAELLQGIDIPPEETEEDEPES